MTFFIFLLTLVLLVGSYFLLDLWGPVLVAALIVLINTSNLSR